MKTLKDIEIKDKTFLVRVDYNTPLKKNENTSELEVASDLRIRASLPTINYLRENGAAKIILISHLGRPDSKKSPEENQEFSLKPVFDTLKSLIDAPTDVKFCDEVYGDDVKSAVKNLKNSGILLLENLRFYPSEEGNSEEFAKNIIDSTNPDYFVQDGFAVIHRAHASISAITQLVPSVAGLLLEKEISALGKVKDNPEHPFILVLGGAKVADKQPLIDAFLDKADKILVGGKIAADGYISDNPKILVATDFDENGEGEKLDIGPLSAAEFAEQIRKSKTVVWNGLLGYAEDPAYATSSTIIAETLGEDADTFSVICGGDTSGFVEELQEENPDLDYDLVSTGGGAALEFLCGNSLPGLEALE